MSSYNRVILMGNITRDFEVRHTPAGTAVTDVTVAVNHRVKSGDDWVDEPTFVDVTLWGRTAEVAAEYLSKGDPVLLEGRLKLDRWEADGETRSKLKVVGERLHLLRKGNALAEFGKNVSPAATTPAVASEDLPF